MAPRGCCFLCVSWNAAERWVKWTLRLTKRQECLLSCQKWDCANVLFVFVSFVLNVDDSGTRDDSVVVEQKVKETIFERG